MSARPTAWTPAHSAFRVRASRLAGALLAAIRQTRPLILAVSVPLSALALVAISTGCAGYRMGARSLYRNDLRTVHVPMIESSSFRRNLGERLTEAVVKQIELTTPYKVVGDPATAESVLR